MDKPKMNFFFDYIYYRITQLCFKTDGRTGFTGILLISMVQTIFIGAILVQISKWTLTEDTRALYGKPFGFLGTLIMLCFLMYNYKKYNGMYNKYRYYWKNETGEIRILKAFCIFLTALVPIAFIILVGVNWDK